VRALAGASERRRARPPRENVRRENRGAEETGKQNATPEGDGEMLLLAGRADLVSSLQSTRCNSLLTRAFSWRTARSRRPTLNAMILNTAAANIQETRKKSELPLSSARPTIHPDSRNASERPLNILLLLNIAFTSTSSLEGHQDRHSPWRDFHLLKR
jgi:hypothetical protein